MKVDLFEVLEGLFSGVIQFLYNICTTTVTLLRHPLAGPAHLYLRHMSVRRRQLGGQTYLFVVFFLTMMWIQLSGWNAPKVSDIGKTVLTSGSLDGDLIWPAIIAAVLSATTIDVALRILAWLKLRQRRIRTKMTVSLVEYAMLSPVVSLTLAWTCWVVASSSDSDFGFYSGTGTIGAVLGTLGAAICLIIGPIPPIALLARGLKIPPARFSASRVGRWLIGWLGIWLLVLFAFGIGSAPMAIRFIEEMDLGDTNRFDAIKVRQIRCSLRNPNPHVDVLLYNEDEAPLMVSPDMVFLVPANFESGYPPPPSPNMSNVPLLILPKSHEVVRYTFDDDDYSRFERNCFLLIVERQDN